MWNSASGALSFTNCTVTNNTSGTLGAGVYVYNGGAVSFRNTVVAGNIALNGSGYSDIEIDTTAGSGVSFTTYGYNLIGSNGSSNCTWTSTDLVGSEATKQPANLAALANNGGYVLTHRPNNGSQAVNPAESNGAPWVDAAGYLRVISWTWPRMRHSPRSFRGTKTTMPVRPPARRYRV
jgi:hypothetical protein